MRHASTIIGIILAPLIAYFVTRWLVADMNLGDNTVTIGLTGLAVVLIILIVPYFILKGLFHDVRLRDGKQKEFKVKDLPDDAPPHA